MDRLKSPEYESRVKEMTRKTLDHFNQLLENFAYLAEEKKDADRSTTKELMEALLGFSAFLNPEELNIGSIRIFERSVRADEEKDFLRGKDPGIRVRIVLTNNTEINFNIFGGLRQQGEMDSRQNVQSQRKGESSADFTHTMLSERTQININVLTEGLVERDVWFSITPVLTPPAKKSMAISTFNDISLKTDTYRTLLPNLIDRESFNIDATRKIIEELAPLREKNT